MWTNAHSFSLTLAWSRASITFSILLGVLLMLNQVVLAEVPTGVDRILYVSPAGKTAAAGSADAPLASIQEALDRATPGTQVRVAKGIYRGRVRFTRGGAFGKPVILEGEPGAILDGSDTFTPQWSPADDIAPGVYRAQVPFQPFTVTVDGKHLTLLDESRVTQPRAGSEEWTWQSIFARGIWNDRNKVHRWEGVRGLGLYLHEKKQFLVKFHQNLDPRQMRITLAPREAVVTISGQDRCIVRGLELRGAWYGVYIERSLGSGVEHCAIGPTDHGVWLDEGADRCTVRFNRITLGSYSDLTTHATLAWDTWVAYKRGGYYDRHGVRIHRTIGGHEVHDNYIFGHWDGVSTTHFTQWPYSLQQRQEWAQFNQNLHVHHNRIENLNDDALEPTGALRNARWHDNLVINARCGFRIKIVDVGPLYIYRNIFINNREDLRIYGEMEMLPAEVYTYHNTTTAPRAINSNKVRGIGAPNYHFYNNLSWCEAWWGNLDSVDPNWQGDHNVYVRRKDIPAWDTGRALADKQKIDQNSRWITQTDPAFKDPAKLDFSLTDGSPARAAGTDLAKAIGRELPGAVSGKTPDAGALQFAEPMPQWPRSPASVNAPPAGFWPPEQ